MIFHHSLLHSFIHAIRLKSTAFIVLSDGTLSLNLMKSRKEDAKCNV